MRYALRARGRGTPPRPTPMEPIDQKHQDTEWSPNLTINSLPDEILIEIFDLYRQSIYQYHRQWRKNYAWFNLAHVCRRWRAAMFASSFRLDLNIIVGPKKPSHIKTILSGNLPILIDYSHSYGPRDTIDSALERMRATLRHCDRVREISFGGYGAPPLAVDFRKFFRAAKFHFPSLESLDLWFPYGYDEPGIPATFLRGPDLSDLCLRRLRLYDGSLASVSGLLLSATALTDLTLRLTPIAEGFDSSQVSFLLACLQGMQCLRSLDLATPYTYQDVQSQHSTPKDIVPLLKLTRFHYSGLPTFLNNIMSGLSTPSLRDARFEPYTESPVLYLSRVIDDIKEEFRSVSVTFNRNYFRLLSSTHSGEIDHLNPASFTFNVNCSSYSINSLNCMPSTKLAMVEELALNFHSSNTTNREHVFSLRKFICQFRNVRLLRVNPFVWEVGLYLRQDDGLGGAILPVLEEVELSILPWTFHSSGEYQRRGAEALAAFEPCKRAGRPVKVYCYKQTPTQSRNQNWWCQ